MRPPGIAPRHRGPPQRWPPDVLGVGMEHGDTGDGVVPVTTLDPPARRGDGPPDPYAAERDAWAIVLAAQGLGPVGFATLLARVRDRSRGPVGGRWPGRGGSPHGCG